MSDQKPVTYETIKAALGISHNRVKGLIRKARITRIATGPRSSAIYPPGTIETLRKLNAMPPLRKSKVSHTVQDLGGSEAEQAAMLQVITGMNNAYARREPSAVSQPPAGLCQYPGCDLGEKDEDGNPMPARAIIGRYCGRADHYAKRFVDAEKVT